MTSAERLRDIPRLACDRGSSLQVFGELVADPDPRGALPDASRVFADLRVDAAVGRAAGGTGAARPELAHSGARADALGGMGSAAVADLVPELVSALADRDENVRWAVIQALRNVGAGALTELAIVLEYGDRLLLPGVLATVIELGPVAVDTAVYLLPYLASDDSEVRALTAEALGSVGATEAADALHTALDDQAEEVRLAAAWALAALGTDVPVMR